MRLKSLIFFLLLPSLALAFDLGENFSQSQVKDVIRGANTIFSMRPLNGASSKGLLVGFELGVNVNATQADLISDIPAAKDFPSIFPAPNLYAAIGIPVIDVAIEAQGVYVPEIKGVSFYSGGANLMWASKKVLSFIPFFEMIPFLEVAPRLTFSKFGLKMQQTQTTASGKGNFDAEVNGMTYGANLSFSAKLPPISPVYVEPYVGAGFLTQSGDATMLVAATSAAAPGAAASVEQKVKEDSTALHYFGGLQLKLFLIALTAEYDRVFDQNSYSGKLSLKF